VSKIVVKYHELSDSGLTPIVLMPAFAKTIHESQGLSLQTAIVDAVPVTVGPKMIYIGLSCVSTPRGLHLVDLDRAKIVLTPRRSGNITDCDS